MRKLYNEYFHIPKDGKIGDKVMLVRVAVTAVCMVFCLAAMGITAYAYFSYNVTSSFNSIQTGKFDATVSIMESDTPVELTTQGNGDFQVTLLAGKTYQVTVTPGGTGASGFCIMKAGADKTYHTQQLSVDLIPENQSTPSMTFTLQTTEDMAVTFTSHWGTSSYYDAYSNKGENEELYITNGETVVLGAQPVVEE